MLCAICLEEDAPGDTHTLTCGHTFHCRCLVPWLVEHRSCPSCRADVATPDQLGYLTIMARASYLRTTVARRRTAPLDLLALVARVRRAEEQERTVARDSLAFHRTHRDVLRQARGLRVRRWTSHRRVQRLLRVLGAFASPEYPLPGLGVTSL